MKIVHETKSGGAQRQSIILGGQFVLVCGIIFCFWLYLWSFRLKILHNRRNALFLILCIFVSCILTELCVTYALFNVYILPYAIVPIVVRTFFDSRTALFTHLVIVLICSLMVPFPHEFLLLQIIAGMVVTFSLRDLSERSQLIRCAFLIFMSYTLCYISLALYQEADFNKINWLMLLYFGINFILLMFTYILVYMLEKHSDMYRASRWWNYPISIRLFLKSCRKHLPEHSSIPCRSLSWHRKPLQKSEQMPNWSVQSII